MSFDEVLARVLDLLQRQGRVSYRALKRRFDLDDDYLEDLKAEIIKAQRLAIDEDGEVLVWVGAEDATPAPAHDQERPPLSYTPTHLAEKILNSRTALGGERKLVTVLFANILPSEEKRLVQTAAVMSTEVPFPLLHAIAELPEETLHRGLAYLQAAEFLYETRLFPEREYTFKHALTHEVAYGGLLQDRRRVLHARIVEAIETLYSERLTEQVEQLAHHAWRGEVWHKALAYFRQAGEKALARSAYREAVGYFEQALSALPHLPEQRHTREQAIDLRLALRTALAPSADFERILAYLHEAETLAEALDDPRRLGQVSRFLSLYFHYRGAYDQAITSAQRALALATASGEVVLHALANQYLGYAYYAQGDYRQAIDCLGQTVASLDGVRRYERFGQVFVPAVISRVYLASCHAELGTFVEGTAIGTEGLRIAEAVAQPGSLMAASWGIGLLFLRQGDLHRALPLLERAVGICQDTGLPVYFPGVAAALGAAYTLGGVSPPPCRCSRRRWNRLLR
jgi:tetratricopeptide (TPR) repeat protein